MMLRWLPVVLWIAVILGLSSIPSPGPSRQLFPGIDKLVHMGEYSVLGFLFARAIRVPLWAAWRAVLPAAMFGLLIGSADESYQMSVPGRDSDLLDVAADVIGASLGGLFWLRWQRRSATTEDVQRRP